MNRINRAQTNRLVQIVFDLLGLLAAWYGTVDLRLLLNPYMSLQLSRAELVGLAPPLTGIILLWLGADLWLKASRPKGTLRVGERLLGVAESVMLASTLTIVVTFFSREFGATLSRSFVFLFVPVSFATLMLARYAALMVVAALERRWPAPERVAVLGEGEEARRIVDRVRNSREAVTLAGVILPEHASAEGLGNPVPVLGTTRQLAEVINHTRLDRIIVVKGCISDQEVDECGAISQRMGVVLSHAIGPVSLQVRVRVAHLCGMPLVDLRPVAFTRRQEIVKRGFDIIVSAVALMFLSPVALVVAAVIKLTSEGPVLFKSPRVGRGGRYFTFLKFRSMYTNPNGRQALAAVNEKTGHIFKVRNDPRITPFGRLMRKYSIDELAQLINVLRGDMSLVGPRPLPAEDLDPDGQSREFAFWSEQRSRVLPGITGLWQIRGRSDIAFEEMIDLDVEYIRNWSFSLDLRILLETPLVVLTAKGAY